MSENIHAKSPTSVARTIYALEDCTVCDGMGRVKQGKCQACNGEGSVLVTECPRCCGSGVERGSTSEVPLGCAVCSGSGWSLVLRQRSGG